jgi:hypothetical protein
MPVLAGHHGSACPARRLEQAVEQRTEAAGAGDRHRAGGIVQKVALVVHQQQGCARLEARRASLPLRGIWLRGRVLQGHGGGQRRAAAAQKAAAAGAGLQVLNAGGSQAFMCYCY